jgi:hypothetical protein
MTNEFKNLTDLQALQMYEKAIIAWRQRPRIMPFNDQNYLLQRKVALRKECIRRGLLLN